MTKRQVEKFATGYPYPTEYIEILLKKYAFDKDRVKEILCSSRENVMREVQTGKISVSGKCISTLN